MDGVVFLPYGCIRLLGQKICLLGRGTVEIWGCLLMEGVGDWDFAGEIGEWDGMGYLDQRPAMEETGDQYEVTVINDWTSMLIHKFNHCFLIIVC